MATNKPRFYYDNIATRRNAAGSYIIADAGIVVTDTKAGDYHKSNLRDLRKFTRWKAAGTDTKDAYYDYGSATDVDYAIIFGHNLSGKTVQFDHSADGSNWFAMQAPFVPADNKIILKEFGNFNDRYFRARFTNNGFTEPEVGELVFGKLLEFPLFPGSGFNPKPLDAQSAMLNSVEGNPLGTTVDYVKLAFDLEFWPVSNTFVNATGYPSFQDWLDRCVRRREAFYFAHNSGDFPAETYQVVVPPGAIPDIPYDRNLRHVNIKLIGKTEDFES